MQNTTLNDLLETRNAQYNEYAKIIQEELENNSQLIAKSIANKIFTFLETVASDTSLELPIKDNKKSYNVRFSFNRPINNPFWEAIPKNSILHTIYESFPKKEENLLLDNINKVKEHSYELTASSNYSKMDKLLVETMKKTVEELEALFVAYQENNPEFNYEISAKEAVNNDTVSSFSKSSIRTNTLFIKFWIGAPNNNNNDNVEQKGSFSSFFNKLI